ncbi:MAG: transketolase C-terminal domain-containing protein [Candidatus Omnitrophica bacterium]|nr:transketolase C-terminal domain-containing protein [Candidatus Omnitrophota bacterium]MDD5775496.1 transketolase C-terminal domain-containing protein [Candidatus Omnitrophota bacterium]HQO37883.1 transketolase C-terminal domain-containing protein [Candidatus Omnitrophota bacterium]HQQ06367.1 transketolase C-terminal domain-containing protein [Candidatus Omnitrophota bacterium]
MKRWVRGMRDAFFDSLYAIARKDRNVILVSSDTGAICFERFKRELPSQYINVGIAEQNLIGVAAGMSMAGKTVYVYAIVPFATMRCYEQIRVDLCCMHLPVTVVGIGAGLDYSTLGPTHHGTEDIALMNALPGMTIYSPSDSRMVDSVVAASYRGPGPKYIRIDRTGLPLIYTDKHGIDMERGFSVLRPGNRACIIATGRMSYTAVKVARRLARESIGVAVIDLFRIKPLNEKALWNTVKDFTHIITLEEHFVTSGIGAIMAGIIVRKRSRARISSFGLPEEFCRRYGTRDYLHSIYRLDEGSLCEDIRSRCLKK